MVEAELQLSTNWNVFLDWSTYKAPKPVLYGLRSYLTRLSRNYTLSIIVKYRPPYPHSLWTYVEALQRTPKEAQCKCGAKPP